MNNDKTQEPAPMPMPMQKHDMPMDTMKQSMGDAMRNMQKHHGNK